MINILITDDNPNIRAGVKQIISEEIDMKINGEAENGMQTLELLKNNKYDLLILDINLPDINGLEVLHNLKHSEYKIPVLILSVFPEEQFALKMIEAGAIGYLNKMDVSDNLIYAINKVMAGEYYFKSTLSEDVTASIHNFIEKIRGDNLLC